MQMMRRWKEDKIPVRDYTMAAAYYATGVKIVEDVVACLDSLE